MNLDIQYVRRQFPAFREPSLQEFAHFENAGGSYACGHVIERLNTYYRCTKVQPYYAFAPSREAGELMDSARARLAAWLNVDIAELHFGPSTSQNTFNLAQALRTYLAEGDEIIVTNQDHEANIGAWRRLEDAGMVVREWSVDPTSGELDIADLQKLLGKKTRMVAFTHCSNVMGTIHEVREITDMIHAAGAIAVVDGVAFSPHGLPDLRAIGADVYLFSLYKVYGPHLGAMYLRADLNAEWPPQGHFFNAAKPASRFTPAGPDHAQIASVNGVIDYFEDINRHHGAPDASGAAGAANVRQLFRAHETRLLQPMLDFLDAHPRVRLLGRTRAEERAPTVSFSARGLSSSDLAARLAGAGLGVGVGNFYAYRLVRALGYDPEDGVVRASFVHYTNAEEVTRLIETLDTLLN